MCLLRSTNWVSISHKTTFFVVTAVITPNLTKDKRVTELYKPFIPLCVSIGMWGTRRGSGAGEGMLEVHPTI
jgi:hypothetical protein